MSRMLGVREFRGALKRAPAELRGLAADGIAATVAEVHARGRANVEAMAIGTSPKPVQKRKGKQYPRRVLRRHYRKSVSRKRLVGKVGYLTRKARREAYYVRFVHNGTAKMAARPFHARAVEASASADEKRMVRARDIALGRLARRRR